MRKTNYLSRKFSSKIHESWEYGTESRPRIFSIKKLPWQQNRWAAGLPKENQGASSLKMLTTSQDKGQGKGQWGIIIQWWVDRPDGLQGLSFPHGSPTGNKAVSLVLSFITGCATESKRLLAPGLVIPDALYSRTNAPTPPTFFCEECYLLCCRTRRQDLRCFRT